MTASAHHDPKWVREGRPLRDWLLELISDTPLTRRLAENAICAMKYGAPVADTTVYRHAPKDLQAHVAEWGRAITDAINAADFPATRFLPAAFAVVKQDRK